LRSLCISASRATIRSCAFSLRCRGSHQRLLQFRNTISGGRELLILLAQLHSSGLGCLHRFGATSLGFGQQGFESFTIRLGLLQQLLAREEFLFQLLELGFEHRLLTTRHLLRCINITTKALDLGLQAFDMGKGGRQV
jgi:hypothetical protein